MGPQQVMSFLAFLIVFASIMLVIKWSFDHLRDRNVPQKEDHSLRVSELQALIEDSVVRATEPLHQQLDRLEERVEKIDKLQRLGARNDQPSRLSAAKRKDDPSSSTDS